MGILSKSGFVIKKVNSSFNYIRYSDDGSTFTAASAEATAEAANVPMEGRNLLRNSNIVHSPNITIISNGVQIDFSNSRDTYFQNNYSSLLSNYAGKTVTISFDVSGLADGDDVRFYFYGKYSSNYILKNGRNTFTFNLDNYLAATFYDAVRQSTQTVTITNIKLEEGAYVSDWTPAPEDTILGTTVGKYMGILTWEHDYAGWDFSQYKWNLVKGDKGDTGLTGNGISAVTNYYQASASATGVTTTTGTWSTSIPTLTPTLMYLWNYETITYTNGTSVSTTPHIISGANGNIKKIVELYNKTNSATSSEGPGWVTTPYTINANERYLWNKEQITYMDGTVSYTTQKVIGVWGDSGIDALNISLSPSSILLTEKSDNTFDYSNATSTIQVLRGSTAVNPDSITISATNCTATLSGSTISITAISTTTNNGTTVYYDNGYVDATVVVGSTTLTTRLNFYANLLGTWYERIEGDFDGRYATKTEYNTLAGTVANNSSAITQNSTSITQEVNNRTTAIDNIQIGGRNLLRNSDFSKTFNYWNVESKKSDRIIEAVTYDNKSCIHFKNIDFWQNGELTQYITVNKDIYIISFDVYMVSGASIVAEFDGASEECCTFYPTIGKWTRVSSKFSCPNVDTTSSLKLNFYAYYSTAATTIEAYITNVKIEEGNKATTWTPAPEDVEADYTAKVAVTANSITQEVTARQTADSTLQSQITVNANSITQKVAKTDYDANNDVIDTHFSTIEQTADKIRLSVSESAKGKNLLEQTDWENLAITGLDKWFVPTGATFVSNFYGNRKAIQVAIASGSTSLGNLYQTLTKLRLNPSTWYTLSWYGTNTAEMDLIFSNAALNGSTITYDITNTKTATSSEVNIAFAAGTEIVRHVVTFKTPATFSNAPVMHLVATAGCTMNVCMIMLEEGTSATTWAGSEVSMNNALKDTAIDVKNKQITATADNFIIQDNYGQKTITSLVRRDTSGNILNDINLIGDHVAIGTKNFGDVMSVQDDNVFLRGYLRSQVQQLQYADTIDYTTITPAVIMANKYLVGSYLSMLVIARNTGTNNTLEIYLPNDYEYIGSHVFIIAAPWYDDTGTLQGSPSVQIRTGRHFNKHSFMTASGNDYDIQTDYVNSSGVITKYGTTNKELCMQPALQGAGFFIGRVSSTHCANKLTMTNGYIELVGVPSLITKPVCPYQATLDSYGLHTITDSYAVIDTTKTDSIYSIAASKRPSDITELASGKTFRGTSMTILQAPICQWVILGNFSTTLLTAYEGY